MAKAKAPIVVTTPSTAAPVALILGPDTFAEKRDAAALAGRQAEIGQTAYAADMVDKLGKFFWRKENPTGFKFWKEEKPRYEAACKAQGSTNVSQQVNRFIEYARQVCEGVRDKNGKRNITALDKRAETQAVALYKAFVKEDEKSGLDAKEDRIFKALKVFITDGLGKSLASIGKK